MGDRKSGNSNIPNSAIAVGVAAAAAVGGLLYYWFNKDSEQENNYAHGGGTDTGNRNFPNLPSQVADWNQGNCPDSANREGRDNIDICSICCENLFTEDETVSAPVEIPCNHYFHMACIRKWFKEVRSCPLCATRIPDDLKAVYF